MQLKHADYIRNLITASLTALAATSCGEQVAGTFIADEPSGGNGEVSVLSMRVEVGRIDYGEPSGRYTPDELPANANELMQSLRIIILDGNGFAEHNSYWSTTPENGAVSRSVDFPIKSNDTKTVILLANEMSLQPENREFFEGINASAGEYVDIAKVRSLTMTGLTSTISGPLVMSDIHTVAIGNAPFYSRTLPITRAAVKLTYRITNHSSAMAQSIYSVGFDRAAERQYLFGGKVLASTGELTSKTFVTAMSVGAMETVEAGPYYIAEGPAYSGYQATLRLTRTSAIQRAALNMRDLPRNTHVIVNIGLNHDSRPTISYVVCPWEERSTDIPDFN